MSGMIARRGMANAKISVNSATASKSLNQFGDFKKLWEIPFLGFNLFDPKNGNGFGIWENWKSKENKDTFKEESDQFIPRIGKWGFKVSEDRI